MLANEFLLKARVSITPALEAGPSPRGYRRVIPITGGTFEGPKLRGTVLPGEDRQTFLSDGTLEVVAHYALQTEDGAIILVTNRGFWHGPAEVGARLAQGEPVDPSLYYFRTCARLEAPSGSPYAWLNHRIIVGSVAPTSRMVVVDFFSVS
jgi:hypothetical protein